MWTHTGRSLWLVGVWFPYDKAKLPQQLLGSCSALFARALFCAGYDGSIHMMTTNGLMLTEKLSYKHQPPSCLEWMSGPNKLLRSADLQLTLGVAA